MDSNGSTRYYSDHTWTLQNYNKTYKEKYTVLNIEL